MTVSDDDANSLDSSDDELDAPLPPKSPSPPLVLQKRRGSIHPPALEALEGDAPERLRQGSFLARRRGSIHAQGQEELRQGSFLARRRGGFPYIQFV